MANAVHYRQELVPAIVAVVRDEPAAVLLINRDHRHLDFVGRLRPLVAAAECLRPDIATGAGLEVMARWHFLVLGRNGVNINRLACMAEGKRSITPFESQVTETYRHVHVCM